MSSPKRFYIITGKGGVGKTSVALALVDYLQQAGKKAKYYYLHENKTTDPQAEATTFDKFLDKLKITYKGLELYREVQTYVALKLKSNTIAHWVVRTPFFKAMFNMLPGFSYLIYLGSILQDLHDDNELIAVLDSPASGHALTMLEATGNFREIFKKGVIFDDTTKMLNFLTSEGTTKLVIVSLPTEMSVHESQDLVSQVDESGLKDICLVLNNTFCNMKDLADKDLPHFLERKITLEKQVIKDNQLDNFPKIPYSTSEEQFAIIKDLSRYMEELI